MIKFFNPMVRLGCATVALLSLFSCGQEKFNNSSSYAEKARAYFESNATALCYPNTSSSDAIGMDNTIFPVWSKASVTKDDDGCILVEAPLGGSPKLMGSIFEYVGTERINHPALVFPYLAVEFHDDVVKSMYVKTEIDQCYFSDYGRESSVKDGITILLESDLFGKVLDSRIIAESKTTRIGYNLVLQLSTKGSTGEWGFEGAWYGLCPMCGQEVGAWHTCPPLCPWCGRMKDYCTCNVIICEYCGEDRNGKYCSCYCPDCGWRWEYCICKPR